mmetsp:Transcript_99109/g.275973  ORF Transcript_99109/g.275973 Transcript_99109/m.275973 type:complete len:202 (-) Transcript_99109:47-652(-)
MTSSSLSGVSTKPATPTWWVAKGGTLSSSSGRSQRFSTTHSPCPWCTAKRSSEATDMSGASRSGTRSHALLSRSSRHSRSEAASASRNASASPSDQAVVFCKSTMAPACGSGSHGNTPRAPGFPALECRSRTKDAACLALPGRSRASLPMWRAPTDPTNRPRFPMGHWSIPAPHKARHAPGLATRRAKRKVIWNLIDRQPT